MKARAADVTLSLYWDDKNKSWTATATGTGHSEWLRIRTTAPVDQAAAWLLLQALQREMESWLAV